MNRDELNRSWNRDFPESQPVADQLKWIYDERWLRIHVLPGSKRYPDDEAEYREILRRHNSIMCDLFGAGQPYLLITVDYVESPEDVSGDAELKKLNLQANHWMSINISDEPEEFPNFWQIYYDEKTRTDSSLNELFRLVADEVVSSVMLYSVEKKILYHPYDGGADIIFENSALRDLYKEKYKGWLSDHPQGL